MNNNTRKFTAAEPNRSIISSIGDSSQLSDLSAIYPLSHSSSTRPSTRTDSIPNISECQASSTIREPANKSAGSCSFDNSVSNIPKILKLITNCETAMANHTRFKIMYDCLHELAQSDGTLIQNTTATKLNAILMEHDVTKYLKLPSTEKDNRDNLNLLGIDKFPQIQLTHNEKREIKVALDNLCQKKMNNFLDCYEKSGGKIEEALKSDESAGKASLSVIHRTDSKLCKETIDSVCTEYYQDLLHCNDMIRHWKRLKYAIAPDLEMENAENLLMKAQFSEAQANITKKICASRMFQETPTTADAFKILSERLDDTIDETRKKIEEMKILKIKYADVSGPEYDRLVKRHAELRDVITKRERLLEIL